MLELSVLKNFDTIVYMTKPKIKPRSKYVKTNPRERKIAEKSFEERAKEFLTSGTPASYATQVVLALAILSGAAMLGATAPGLTVAARQYRRMKGYSDKQIWDATYALKKSGYVKKYSQGSEKPRIKLTKKGKEYFEKILFEDIQLPEPEQWGGKWTFVVFDIPVGHGKAREALRWRLKMLGFYQYQKSVWAYPHPCEKEILFVADHFGVGKFVEIFSVDRISNDLELKKHFRLK
jgi:DNA-binding PadR family transcriptional regulator